MIEFTCCEAYKEEQAWFRFFPKLFYAGEYVVVEIIEAKGIPQCVLYMRRAFFSLPGILEFSKWEKGECCLLQV